MFVQASNPYDKVDSKVKAMLSRYVKTTIAPGFLVKSTTTGSRKKAGPATAKGKAKARAKAAAKKAGRSKPSPAQEDDTEAESDDAAADDDDARKEREEEEVRMASIF